MTHKNHTLSVSHSWKQGPAVITAVGSLTGRHLDRLIQHLETLSLDAIVDIHLDYEGYRSFLITFEHGPQFLLSGRADRVAIAEVRGDELIELGCFSRIEPAASEIARHVC